MGILSDAEELAKAFPKASWPTKIIMLSGFFGSITSLASISESVYKWKGFVAKSIEIYDKYVKSPFAEVLDFLPFQIPAYTLDYLILSVCTVLAMYRAIESDNLQEPNYTKRALLLVYLVILVEGFVMFEKVFDGFTPALSLIAKVSLGLIIMPLLFWYVTSFSFDYMRKKAENMMSRKAPEGIACHNRSSSIKKSRFVAMSEDLVVVKCTWSKYYLQIGLYVLTLLILAGITEGLAKPLP
tara:strand:+ start:4593 stop:5315 length:723 start_codon:yes stop_codon:yes gene_type:complete